MKLRLLALSLLSLPALSQRVYHDDHHHDPEGRAMNHDHLTHIQEYRKETVYVHHLPAPQVMSGIGTSDLKIQTKSSLTQTYFNQALPYCMVSGILRRIGLLKKRPVRIQPPSCLIGVFIVQLVPWKGMTLRKTGFGLWQKLKR
ncbi:hypothetical protein [Siphonobacter sp. SORGH_AS_0500]|uniref:hypothetical protein n=1 Tax=Siphonobacter sp. SORGH_AS_0500 TaxID=1864824 RepID=UPI0012FF5A28|nr:hypothetical protein [Siphonobacter sp. SORGH_AS_0500]